MRKIYLATLLTEFIILISQLVSYRLAASYLGKEGFSEYALAKRIIALLLPAVMLGLGIAIPRFVALSVGEESHRTRSGYLSAGVLLFVASSAASLTMLNIFKRTAAQLFFGSAAYSYLIPPVSLIMVGLGLHTLSYGYFRGNLQMNRANAIQFANHGIVPLIVFPLFGSSIYSVLTALGTSWCVTSSLALLFSGSGLPSDVNSERVRQLLRYGLGRVPADFIQLAFLTLPATFTAHIYGITQAGFVAFGTSILTMVASLFFPVGTVLLPEVSQMVAKQSLSILERRAIQVLGASSAISIVITIGILLFARPIITLYLGSSFIDIVSVVRIMALGVLPYSIYVCLKNVIDAASDRAVNSKNMLIAFAALAGISSSVYWGLRGPLYIPGFVVICLYLLGILTLLEVRKVLAVAQPSTRSCEN